MENCNYVLGDFEEVEINQQKIKLKVWIEYSCIIEFI